MHYGLGIGHQTSFVRLFLSLLFYISLYRQTTVKHRRTTPHPLLVSSLPSARR